MSDTKELPEVMVPTKFQPGNPGGPGRTPGKILLRTVLKRILHQEIDFENPLTKELEKLSINEVIALKLIKRALDGNLRAIELIFDRVDGKVADMLQLGNIDDKPLEIGTTLKYDFSKLSTDELLFVRNILDKSHK